MSPEQFVYWLQGFIEMNPNAMLTHTQWEILKDHLKLVMDKKTPQRATPHTPYNPGVIPGILGAPRELGDPAFPYTVTC